MARFDPRAALQRSAAKRRSARTVVASFACVGIAAIGVGGFARLATPRAEAGAPGGVLSATLRVAARAHGGPVVLDMAVERGETLDAALARTGVTPAEAHAAVQALAEGFDTAHIRAGLAFQAVVARGADAAPGRLTALTLPLDGVTTLRLDRGPGGALALSRIQAPVHEETAVAQGEVRGSLYESAIAAGADSRLTAEVVKLFGKKLDFARDFKPGDPFRLAFDRTVTADGRLVALGALRYAEIDAKGATTRFYRFDRDGEPAYFDEQGHNVQGFLLKTPIDGARVTSSFGMRFHPLLAYNRMHQGVDFGAPTGTPVYAAGDGVVAEVKRSGGYGNWLEIRHAGGWATGYGHLSRYVRGLRVGERVKQGQVVAYVGSTGLSTGPHLHYELMSDGRKVDPRGVKAPQGVELAGGELRAFQAQRTRIDGLLAKAGAPDGVQFALLNLRGGFSLHGREPRAR